MFLQLQDESEILRVKEGHLPVTLFSSHSLRMNAIVSRLRFASMTTIDAVLKASSNCATCYIYSGNKNDRYE
jgi:hypothetical protein